MRITFISDTHTKERNLRLPGGDVLIHAGDIMNSGWNYHDIHDFLKWFQKQNYDELIFIAGNHDRKFETDPLDVKSILEQYPLVTYLEDDWVIVGDGDPHDPNVKTAKIYGSPWQPEFYNWAFNLPRNGWELEQKWKDIPEDTDILVTHGPPQGHLDASGPPWNQPNLGCELLRVRVDDLKPKIHVFGHIHGSAGHKEYGGTHFINASILNEDYVQVNDGVTIDWDPETNEVNFI
jgi:Icc-related predicted phosphoesterase